MKIVALPIKIIAVFEPENKPPIPYKFKVKIGDSMETVKVDKIISTEKKRVAGIDSFIYQCQSYINGIERRYELKYIIGNCQWQLYKA